MKNRIFINKELSTEDEKRIKTNLRKIGNALHDLREMGYNMYLSPNHLSVCDGDVHPDGEVDRSVEVATLTVYGIDGGDW